MIMHKACPRSKSTALLYSSVRVVFGGFYPHTIECT